ncbi:gamma-glutamyl-gamma-aminobutyrate hydrolase family protein [Rhodococcus sp. NPDC056960]|uniref:gamma-glutamyl-gamma-aminobutyrate hydrolase family protein n=1 Tax=Rhodococcus sp. NPDC056960 TaxID=3345982 RepID=UPI00362F7D76
MSAPLIGITGRRLSGSVITGQDARYTGVQIDNFFTDYSAAVAKAGGVPVLLPYEAVGSAVVDHLDGVIITGGQDIDPRVWGGVVDPTRGQDRTNPHAYDTERDVHEIGVVRAALERGIPLLGVCRGHQVLNVACGGTLISDLGAPEIEHYSPHSAPHTGTDNHLISFAPDSLAASVYGPSRIRNSYHHQAIDDCGSPLVVTGRTDDGIVEAIEIPGAAVLGVQWHPEWQPGGDPVFSWLVAAAARAARSADTPPADVLEWTAR